MKLKAFLITAAAVMVFGSRPALAKVGDMGFFGGIIDGRNLPKTTDILLEESENNAQTDLRTTFVYKEPIFISGRPVEFEGIMEVSNRDEVEDGVNVGTYTMSYRVTASATTDPDVSIERSITFNVNYHRDGKQIIKNFEMTRWTEVLTTPDGTFTLDPAQSSYGISLLEDHRAGAVYYRGDISMRGVYTEDGGGAGGGDGGEPAATTLVMSGSFHGYETAWSTTETHRLDAVVGRSDGTWDMQYQLRPSVTVSKTLQYVQNEPTAISFAGNYREVISKQSGLRYDIFVMPRPYYYQESTGGFDIPSANAFEQLRAVDTGFLRGHMAEEDIRRLFSMNVLDGEPKFYLPDQAITRAQYVAMLVKAVKLPAKREEAQTGSGRNRRNTQTVVIPVFPDVGNENPYYPYIMAGYEAGIAWGRSNGYFYADYPIERQEAITLLVRSLGLENLSPDPTPITAFTDDHLVADWAKRELYAAELIGLIGGDADGNIRPTEMISKAEAAAIVNRLVNFMCSELSLDYADHIVNYAN